MLHVRKMKNLNAHKTKINFVKNAGVTAKILLSHKGGRGTLQEVPRQISRKRLYFREIQYSFKRTKFQILTLNLFLTNKSFFAYLAYPKPTFYC